MKLEKLKEFIKTYFNEFQIIKMTEIFEKDNNTFNYMFIFHHMQNEKDMVIYNKFIFPLNNTKDELREYTFLYLYEINCKYKKVEFTEENLKMKLDEIFQNNRFGKDLIYLSKFLNSPEMSINDKLFKNGIEKFSVFSIEYSPKVTITPCQDTTFDFKINVNNDKNIELRIKKDTKYIFTFKYLNKIENVEQEDLSIIEDVVITFLKNNI